MKRRTVLRPLGVGTVVGALMALLFLSGALESWSHLATDRLAWPRAADPAILIVAIDDASLAELGRWPWSRLTHAELIRKLHASGAAAIGYDVNFPEASDPTADAALAEALATAGNVVLPVELKLNIAPAGLTFDPRKTVAPLPGFSGAARTVGHTNTPPDPDGVVRRVPLAIAAPDGTETPAFAVRAAEVFRPQSDFRFAPVDAWNRLRVNFNGPPHTTFRVVSAADVVRWRVQASDIRGKLVFVGATAPDLHDEQIVPTSAGAPMPGVEIHASLTDTLLNQRWLTPLPVATQALIVLLCGVLVGLLIAFFRVRISLPLTAAVWGAFIVAVILAYDAGYVIDIVWPTLTLGFAYAAVTLERRVTADRERSKLRTAFSHYVASPVVEAILRDPSKLRLGGEKRNMSVLFSDVRGFTSLSETLPPERLVHVMNTYLTRMTEMIFATDGVLDKYIGDAVMAFWNAPFDQKDHALRAVKTAIAMQRALADMNRQHYFGTDLELAIGIGINTGDMIVGNMGSEARFDYTVIGDHVNLASRVEGMTKEYGVGILITETTRLAAGDAIVARRIDKVAVKGRREPTVVYEVIGLASQVTKQEKQLANDFEEAFERYLNGDFEDAIAICGSILQDHPNDGPCRTIIARSHQFLLEAPTMWDGTWTMKTK